MIMMPVSDHISGICEESVVRMHNAFWRAGRTRRKSQVTYFIGILVTCGKLDICRLGARKFWPSFARGRDAIDLLHGRQASQCFERIVPGDIRSPAFFDENGLRRKAIQ